MKKSGHAIALIIAASLEMLGCGAKVTVNDPVVKVEGQVRHTVDINWDNLRQQIERACRAHLSGGGTVPVLEADVEECVNETILSLLRLI